MKKNLCFSSYCFFWLNDIFRSAILDYFEPKNFLEEKIFYKKNPSIRNNIFKY